MNAGIAMRLSKALPVKRAGFVKDGCIALGIGVGFLSPMAIPLAVMAPPVIAAACTTKTLETFSGVSGFNFEISRSSCGLFTKEESIDVLVSRDGDTQKASLLLYVPAVDELPVIKSVGTNSVQISVPKISSLYYGNDRWETLSVDYNIGVIDHPARNSGSK